MDIKTVCECCHCLGSKTLHPQVSLINLEKPELEEDAVKFEFYAILLIEDCPDGCCCCGRKYYDYSVATMVFLTPGEIFRMSKEDTLPPKGWLLAFHPDLLFRTSLKNHIKNYTFFSYHKEEALHLSRRETSTVTCLLEHIEAIRLMHIPVPSFRATSSFCWIIVRGSTNANSLPVKTKTSFCWPVWIACSMNILIPDGYRQEVCPSWRSVPLR